MTPKRRIVAISINVALAGALLYAAFRFGQQGRVAYALAGALALRAMATGTPLIQDSVPSLLAEGHLRAASWVAAGFAGGALCAQLGQPDLLVGLTFAGVAASGASLQGHHVVFRAHSRGALLAEGLLGTWLALVGWVGFASILGAISPPFTIPAIGIAFVFGLPFALKTTLTLLRSQDERIERHTRAGWFVWYEDSFFLHTMMLTLVVIWVAARPALRAALPRPTLVEYALGALVVATLAMTIRRHLLKRLVEEPVRSVHQMHEARVERVGLARFDELDSALDAFVNRADLALVQYFASGLRPEQAAAGNALRDVVAHQSRAPPLLVPPAWRYGGLATTAVLIAWVAPLWTFPIAAIILYFGGLSRWGGPVWAGPATSVAGALLLFVDLLVVGASPSVALIPLGVALGFVALVAFLRYRKPSVVPGLARTRSYGAEARLSIAGAPARLAAWVLVILLCLPLFVVIAMGRVDWAAIRAAVPAGVSIALALTAGGAARVLGTRANLARLDALEQSEKQERRALCDAALARLASRKPTKRASARPVVAVLE